MTIHGQGGGIEPRRKQSPAVAGLFYPRDPETLREEVRAYLGAADGDEPSPKALIAPHAGYRFSGPIAGTAYARLARAPGTIDRVVLLGPTHRVPVRGIAASSAGAFSTPLGDVPVDGAGVERALAFAQVNIVDAAFREEHSLEVHLPFLQETLGAFRVVPLLVGDASPEEVAEVLDALWGDAETVVVVSSDLSHYLDYDTARRRDAETSRAIESLRWADIGFQDACGRNAVSGLLELAQRRGLRARAVDVRSSGDTAGPRDRVVGYGAYVFHEPRTVGLAGGERRQLLGIARASISRGLRTAAPEPVTPHALPWALRRIRASFVTLKIEGALRGCMGTVSASRALAEDVSINAFNAAFKDPRFPAVDARETDRLAVSISVLSPPAPITASSQADLLRQLRPGLDGLILADGTSRGTFLPAVWQNLSEPEVFVRELKRKAGLTPDHWSDTLRVSRYSTETFE